MVRGRNPPDCARYLLCASVISQNVVGMVLPDYALVASHGYPMPPQNPIDSDEDR